MHKHIIYAADELMVTREEGRDAFGDHTPRLEVSVAMNQVGLLVARGTGDSSNISINPLRLADGHLRTRTDGEPQFHPDAYFLIRITGPEMIPDIYHQFDQNGKYLG